MIYILILILWMIYGVMAASSLFYRQYRDKQILGITLSRAHARDDEIKKTVTSFTKTCYAVFILSVMCSFLLFIPSIQAYGEFCMLILTTINLIANGLIVGLYQKKLKHIKEKNKWEYLRKSIVTIDLNVSKEKGKSSISSLWVWFFMLLSFIPTMILIFSPEIRESYPIALSLIGPFCQLCSILIYYQMRNQHSRVADVKAENNLLYAQQEEGINSITATLSALGMLVFWYLFNLSIIYGESEVLIVAPVIILVVALLSIARWQQKKMRILEETIIGTLSEDDEEIQEDEISWKWGCYYNPNDPRLFVPKRLSGMGWTINIARPAGKVFFLGIIILVISLIGFAFYGGVKEYGFTVNASGIEIDAAMYDINITKEQVASISVINTLPKASRTNGYGGINKSFGHFSIDGYGKCMLYVYKDVDQYIVIDLIDSNPAYVIFNDNSLEKTEALYQNISNWMME